MRELWFTVVRPIFEALSPGVVVVAGPKDEPLLEAVAGATDRRQAVLHRVARPDAAPAETALIVTTADRVISGAIGPAGAVIVVAGALPHDTDVTGRVVRSIDGFGGVAVVLPQHLAGGPIDTGLLVGSIAARQIAELDRARGGTDGLLQPDDLRDARLDALRVRLERQAGELAALRIELARRSEEPVGVNAPLAARAADLERRHERRFFDLYDPVRLLTSLDRAGADPNELAQPIAARPSPPPATGIGGRVAFLLPGLSPGGSGGSHSIVQEALGLRRLGVAVDVLVPDAARELAKATYPEAPDLFVGCLSDVATIDAVAGAAIVVATENTSVPIALAAVRRHGVPAAYYVQDYEPLFAEAGSARADAALLSYRAGRALRLMAKTHWLANLVAATHGVEVSKIRPSLDREIFHAEGREPAGSRKRIRLAAMVRPRTPRRRPVATAQMLTAIRGALGSGVEMVTFGCQDAELAGLTDGAGLLEHHGVLPREKVADLLRGCDLFLDLSVYQAFGRTGLEAMACGAVPILPRTGGTWEYAIDDENAVLHDGPNDVRAWLPSLIRDRPRQARLSAAGIARAQEFDVKSAARSILDVLAETCGRA